MRTLAKIAQINQDIDERLRAVVVEAVAHVTTGEPFTVLHTLGSVPSMVAWLPKVNCNVWAEEADERVWDETKIVLRCNVSAAPLRLVIIE
jgi:hypothetical protein